MKHLSGEKLQEIVDLTIIFRSQVHKPLWVEQIKSADYSYIIIEDSHLSNGIPGEYIDRINDAKSIFVYTHALDVFFAKIYPLITGTFKLMSHNSDHGIENSKYDNFLNGNKLIKWYAQNVNYKHEKLIPIPIGLANTMWPHGNFDRIKDIMNKELIKDVLVYNNFNEGTNPGHRHNVRKCLEKNNIPKDPSCSNDEFLEKLAKSKFCISPFGNGYDCHRVWEALYLKSIPVVPRSVSNEYFAEILPMVLVDDWNEITPEFLNKKYNEYNIDNIDFKSLYIEFWNNLVVE